MASTVKAVMGDDDMRLLFESLLSAYSENKKGVIELLREASGASATEKLCVFLTGASSKLYMNYLHLQQALSAKNLAGFLKGEDEEIGKIEVCHPKAAVGDEQKNATRTLDQACQSPMFKKMIGIVSVDRFLWVLALFLSSVLGGVRGGKLCWRVASLDLLVHGLTYREVVEAVAEMIRKMSSKRRLWL